MGRPEGTAAHEAYMRGPRRGVAHAGLPPQPRRLTAGSRVTARQAGEEKETAAKLVAGSFSGEGKGVYMLASS